MLLNISKTSRIYKNQWLFEYNKKNFDHIVRLILNKMKYDYIELTIWSFQLDLLIGIDYELLVDNKKFSTLILTRNSSIQFTNPNLYDEIRLFEIIMYCNEEKLFKINSDNYGEYTSISMDKTIDKEIILELLDNIFKTPKTEDDLREP